MSSDIAEAPTSDLTKEAVTAAAASYTRVAIGLHWLIAALVICNFGLGWMAHQLDESALDQLITDTHKSFGISVLMLSIARLLWRLLNKPPPFLPSMTTYDVLGARTVHGLLYALMILVPIAGWWMSSAVPGRHVFSFFGFASVPLLPVRTGMSYAIVAHDTHRWLAIAFAALAVGHIAAALRHQFWVGDDVMSRITSWRIST